MPSVSARPAPDPRTSGSVAAHPSSAAPGGRAEPDVDARPLDAGRLEGADDPAVAFRDELSDLLLHEVREDLGAQLFRIVGREASREDRRLSLVVGEERRQGGECVHVARLRAVAPRPAR